MKKKDYIDLIIKAVGCVFIILSITTLPTLIGKIIALPWVISELNNQTGQEVVKLSFLSSFIQISTKFIVYAISAKYFLSQPKYITKILNKTEPAG